MGARVLISETWYYGVDLKAEQHLFKDAVLAACG